MRRQILEVQRWCAEVANFREKIALRGFAVTKEL